MKWSHVSENVNGWWQTFFLQKSQVCELICHQISRTIEQNIKEILSRATVLKFYKISSERISFRFYWCSHWISRFMGLLQDWFKFLCIKLKEPNGTLVLWSILSCCSEWGYEASWNIAKFSVESLNGQVIYSFGQVKIEGYIENFCLCKWNCSSFTKFCWTAVVVLYLFFYYIDLKTRQF